MVSLCCSTVKSPRVCTVTNWCPSWYDLRCCKDIKLQKSTTFATRFRVLPTATLVVGAWWRFALCYVTGSWLVVPSGGQHWSTWPLASRDVRQNRQACLGAIMALRITGACALRSGVCDWYMCPVRDDLSHSCVQIQPWFMHAFAPDLPDSKKGWKISQISRMSAVFYIY